MDEKRKKLIELNVSWKVMKLCHQHKIDSPNLVQEIKQRLVEDIQRTLSTQQLPISELHRVCDEHLADLAIELGGNSRLRSQLPPQTFQLEQSFDLSLPIFPSQMDGEALASVEIDDDYGDAELFSDEEYLLSTPSTPIDPQSSQPEQIRASKPKQYVPEAENYSEKLKRQRKPIKELILGECVQFGLLEPKRAHYLICQLPGKDPREAEKEVVVELRNILYEQVRSFIREYKGGPWSLGQQDEVRLDIMHTPSVRSILSLTLQLVKEQRIWLKGNNLGHASKNIFGKKVEIHDP